MKHIYTELGPAFSKLIKEIANQKGVKFAVGGGDNFVSLDKDFIAFVFYESCLEAQDGNRVTQGQFLDALTSYSPPPKEITFDCKILGHTPILKKDSVKIGCQDFSFESINSFKKEYEAGMNTLPIIADCWTESSTGLRAYVKSICPKDNCCIYTVGESFPFCVVYGNKVQGSSGKRGDYLTPGQFIDRILAAKVKTDFDILIHNSLNHCTFTVTREIVDGKDWGTMTHEEVAAFLKEYSEKVK